VIQVLGEAVERALAAEVRANDSSHELDMGAELVLAAVVTSYPNHAGRISLGLVRAILIAWPVHHARVARGHELFVALGETVAMGTIRRALQPSRRR
jgi:hypothetical protein